jgi:outer membrane receptor for ferrienterochelin and colicins
MNLIDIGLIRFLQVCGQLVRPVAVALAVAMLIGYESQAQTTLELKSGQTNQPMVNANVHVNQEGQQPRHLVSDKRGKVRIPEALTQQAAMLNIRITYVGRHALDTSLQPGQTHTLVMTPISNPLDPLVITGQYQPEQATEAVHQVRVIKEAEIEEMGAVNLRDVMNQTLNVRVTKDNVLGSGMSLQGISGQNVKIMIDGVPVIGRQDGDIDLSQLNLNDVKRIEVIEGPLNVNYGTNALGGTINIITKKSGQDGFGAEASSYFENNGTLNVNGNASFQSGSHHFRLSGGRNYFNGWAPGDGFWPSFDATLADTNRTDQWDPKRQYFGRLNYQYHVNEWRIGYQGSFMDEKVWNWGKPRPPYYEKAFDDQYETERINQSINAKGPLGENWQLNAVAAFNQYNHRKQTYIKDLTTLNRQLRDNASAHDTSQFDLLMSRASFSHTPDSGFLSWEMGYHIRREKAQGQRLRNNTQQLANYALFATAEVALTDKLTLRPGLRQAWNTDYDPPLTPSLNARYKRGDFTLRASYARGFRAPGLKELHFRFVDINHNIHGNPDLEAEYAHNYSLSGSYQSMVDQALLKAEVSTFFNDIRNRIALAQVEGTRFSYVNIGNYKTIGANFESSAVWQSFKLDVGAAYTGRFNDLGQDADGLDAYQFTPQANGQIRYNLKNPDITLTSFYKFQGRMEQLQETGDDEIQETFIDPYHRLDFTITMPLLDSYLTVTTGVKNIMDVTNVNASLGGGAAHSGSGGQVPVGMGRTVFTRLTAQF